MRQRTLRPQEREGLANRSGWPAADYAGPGGHFAVGVWIVGEDPL